MEFLLPRNGIKGFRGFKGEYYIPKIEKGGILHQMNIELLLEQERANSYKIIRSKAAYLGTDFIDDVYCDARYKALKNIKSYDPSKPFKFWWNRILINALTDKINKEKQEVPYEILEEKPYDVLPGILDRYTLSQVVSLLDELPEKQKAAISSIINYEENAFEPKVAKASSERINLHKARKKLLSLLKENFE